MGCHFLLQCMEVKSESEVAQLCLTRSDPMDCSLQVAPPSMGFSRQELGAIAFSLATFNRDSNMFNKQHMGLPRWHSGKESAGQCRRCRRRWFNPWLGKIAWRRKWQPTPVFLPGKSHGQRNLAGYSPRGGKRVGHELATKQQQKVLHASRAELRTVNWITRLCHCPRRGSGIKA